MQAIVNEKQRRIQTGERDPTMTLKKPRLNDSDKSVETKQKTDKHSLSHLVKSVKAKSHQHAAKAKKQSLH